MPDGIGDEFADDTQDGVGGRVAHFCAGDGEPDADSCRKGKFVEVLLYCGVEVRVFQRIVPEVADAARQLSATRLQHPLGGRKDGLRLAFSRRQLRDANLAGDAGEVLRKGVVELRSEAGGQSFYAVVDPAVDLSLLSQVFIIKDFEVIE